MARHFEVTLERIFTAPRTLVWAIVSDTNRVDRATGLSAPRYQWVERDGRPARLAKAKELGFDLEWIEPPYRWIEGRHVEGHREFLKGPAERGGFSVALSEVPQGTLVKARMFVDAPWYVGLLQTPKFRRGLADYFDGIDALLRDAGTEMNGHEPAVVQAQKLFARAAPVPSLAQHTPIDEGALELRGRKLRETMLQPELVERLLAWIRERSDEDVAQMKPFELAHAWNVERRDALRLFLRATEAGVTDLSWQILCPICRVGARLLDSLEALDGKSHCGACDIDYQVDFSKHIEAVFPVSPAIRKVMPSLYCASSPAFLPHVLAQLRIPAGESFRAEIDLPRSIHLRTLWERRTSDVELDADPAELHIRISDRDLHVRAGGTRGAKESTRLLVENETARESVMLIERSAWNSDAVLGTVIASMPEFANLFATEAPAAGVELSVGHIAFLFSDLTGSTALYERIGDAKAFAVVQQHFELMEAIIGRNGGAIVKTMGDAVMASFAGPADALAAALAMTDEHDRAFSQLELGVKIGLHSGPCLAIRANERLDYFGTTVNVAARLQAQAQSSEVVVLESLAEEPSIAPIWSGRPQRKFSAHLKGIAKAQELLAILPRS